MDNNATVTLHNHFHCNTPSHTEAVYTMMQNELATKALIKSSEPSKREYNIFTQKTDPFAPP